MIRHLIYDLIISAIIIFICFQLSACSTANATESQKQKQIKDMNDLRTLFAGSRVNQDHYARTHAMIVRALAE